MATTKTEMMIDLYNDFAYPAQKKREFATCFGGSGKQLDAHVEAYRRWWHDEWTRHNDASCEHDEDWM